MDRMPTMKHFIRKQDLLPADYSPNAALPPRDTFAGQPQVLAAYDTFLRLREARARHLQAEQEKRDAANHAAEDYQAKVQEALRQGADPGKVKNLEPQLRAEAEAHARFAAESEAEQRDAGRQLGELVQAHGAGCFDALEAKMQQASDDITAAVAALRIAWQTWGEAWGVRQHISRIVHQGGGGQHFVGPTIPAGVATALGTVTETLDELKQLKADEQELTRWRRQEAEAQAAVARFAHTGSYVENGEA